MSTFNQTLRPTPFGFFDSDTAFQTEADGMVVFVKRKLGDDVLSVELTKKEIWSCFEEATCEYSRLVHEMRIKSDLVNLLGLPTGSSNTTNVYPRQTLEYLMRQAEPYASWANSGGSFNSIMGYIRLETGKQDYDIYKDIYDVKTDLPIYDSLPSGSKGKLRVNNIFHMEPLAAQQFLLNASNITNFLATNFNYESYVNSTVFYVLPIFEDVLRRSMLEAAFRVRRSHYSYEYLGSNLRIYPVPTGYFQQYKMFVKVSLPQNPLGAAGDTFLSGTIGGTAYEDSSMNGISGPQNVPFDNIPFTTITQPGRQWIRQYTVALCKELLGLIRSKYKTIPIPNADLSLNGEDLIQQSKDEKDKLTTQLKEWLDNLTNQKLTENAALTAENINKQLKYVPFIKGIMVG